MDNQTIGDRLRSAMGEVGENELARRSGVPQSTIHRILVGASRDPRFSNLQKLAKALNVSARWLHTGNGLMRQTDTVEGESLEGEASGGTAKPYRKSAPILSIPQYETGGQGGNDGLLLRDQPGIIENWTVSQEWVRTNVPYCTSPANLCIVTGFGDSMPGVFSPGDPVLVDRGIRSCDHDGIYFFRVGNEGFIKILQRIPGVGILVISQNTNYRDWTLKEGMDFEVFGKVLKAWKGENY